MTSQEFVMWLNGFLEAVNEVQGYQLAKIRSKLKEVNDNKTPEYINPPMPFEPFNPNPFTKPNAGTIPNPYVIYGSSYNSSANIPFTYNHDGQYITKELLKG